MSSRFRALIFLPVLAIFVLFPNALAPSSTVLIDTASIIENSAVAGLSDTSPADEAEYVVDENALDLAQAVIEINTLAIQEAELRSNPFPEAVETGEERLEAILDEAEALVEAAEEEISGEIKKLQQTIFNELWAVVYENYLYPDFNGLDWQAVRREHRERIEAGQSMPVFYQALRDLVASLGDEHSNFLDPDRTAAEDAKYAGSQGFVGVGVLLRPVPERQRATLMAAMPGGPADQAGLKPRDSLLSVDGEPILEGDGKLKSLLRGPEATQVTLVVQSPGGELREITLTRQLVAGPLPLPYTIITTDNGQRIGYLLLISFADSTIPQRIEQAYLEMSREARLDGLIIDNRYNEGGADTVLKNTLALLTDGELGHFIGRRSEKPLQVEGIDLNGSQQIPLVVLVSKETFSYGEIFAGVLQDLGRAYLIGEQTLGNVETLKGYNFRDGSRAWIAHTSFRPLNNRAVNWEQTGITPDSIVQSAWDEQTLESDPAVVAAIHYFTGGVSSRTP